MSDAQNEHQSPIRTPKQLIVVVVLAFVVPIAIIILLVSFVQTAPKTGAGTDAMTPEATAARIAPVAKFELAAAGPATLKTGEETFKAVCATCHAAGIAGAPKFGDPAAWSERISEGVNTLWDHALKGYQGKSGVMPAKGGNSALDDIEVERAVDYMANAAGAKFTDPPAPAGAPAASTSAPAEAAPAAPVAPPAVLQAVAAANASAAAGASTTGDPGQKLFNNVCTACHGQGVAGAPKFGDKAAWAPRIAEGMDTLYTHALQGFQGKNGVMPAKGGSSASDDDVKAAVQYMVKAGK
ncbi:MAG: c-type cytochrome [Burkholderiaceae bacterium]|jgi:cytochrome c5